MSLYLHDVTSEDSRLPHKVFFCWSPSLTKLPMIPPAAHSSLPPFPWQTEWVPSAWGFLTCLMASRSQFCGCLAGQPFPACAVMRTVHRAVLVQPTPAPLHLSRVWQGFTSGVRPGGQHYQSMWLAALTSEPNDLGSNPSSATSCWQDTL